MIGRIESIAPMTGYGHTEIRKSLDAGKVAPEVQERIVQRNLKEQREKISPLYNSRGKLVEDYSQSERRIDILIVNDIIEVFCRCLS